MKSLLAQRHKMTLYILKIIIKKKSEFVIQDCVGSWMRTSQLSSKLHMHKKKVQQKTSAITVLEIYLSEQILAAHKKKLTKIYRHKLLVAISKARQNRSTILIGNENEGQTNDFIPQTTLKLFFFPLRS